MQNIQNTCEEIAIKAHAGNDIFGFLAISDFDRLKLLSISNDCYMNITSLTIQNNKRLEVMVIGNNSLKHVRFFEMKSIFPSKCVI